MRTGSSSCRTAPISLPTRRGTVPIICSRHKSLPEASPGPLQGTVGLFNVHYPGCLAHRRTCYRPRSVVYCFREGDYRGHAGSLLMIVWGVVKRLSIDFPLVAVRLSGVCRALFARAPVRVRQRRCSRFLHAGLAPAIGR